MLSWPTLRSELRPTLHLALPLVLAEIGWISMAIVDTMMVGRLHNSAQAIAAVSISSSLFLVFAFFGEGLLIGLDTLVSQSFGAGHRDDCYHSLINGIYLSLALFPLLFLPVWLLPRFFHLFGVTPDIAVLARPYMYTLAFGILPLLFYFTFRRTLQGMNLVRPIAFALVTANLINFLGNYILVFGHFGFPPLGVVGSGIATVISRSYLAAALIAFLFWFDAHNHPGLRRASLRPDFTRIRRLVGLGLPAGIQQTAEVSVFAIVASLISRLGAVPLASHQIALNTVAFTYMVPLGISSAAAVRVGQAIGRRDLPGARNAGNTAILIGASFMSCMSVVLLVFPRYIARIYTDDQVLIHNAVILLAAGAAFQLFDGIQTVATGALRGTGDTRTPMLCHFCCYWFIGLPLGSWLCFRRHWGPLGLWIGLSASLILIGILLLTFWRLRLRHFPPAADPHLRPV
ncbi:MAG TPA: MATE family efflux transporter [Candidatus Eisenbacteria bacterium]|nr:MATE family efflux transporter [Candidatus Eisenbacteria bacterium]